MLIVGGFERKREKEKKKISRKRRRRKVGVEEKRVGGGKTIFPYRLMTSVASTSDLACSSSRSRCGSGVTSAWSMASRSSGEGEEEEEVNNGEEENAVLCFRFKRALRELFALLTACSLL